MISYDNYINEGYFRQNLYHFTTIYPLKMILKLNNKIIFTYKNEKIDYGLL